VGVASHAHVSVTAVSKVGHRRIAHITRSPPGGAPTTAPMAALVR